VARSLIQDAFDHHVWATKRVAEACSKLTPEQLTTDVAGTYGSILATMRHVVADEWFYLGVLTGRRSTLESDPHTMDIARLSAALDVLAAEWTGFLAGDLDPDAIVREVDDEDGFQRDATVGLHLAQSLHHGNEHRAQICTAFTILGVEPPAVSVFKFGLETGRSVEVYPPS
jgi:uncharacterized damage-inducible protein DinB